MSWNWNNFQCLRAGQERGSNPSRWLGVVRELGRLFGLASIQIQSYNSAKEKIFLGILKASPATKPEEAGAFLLYWFGRICAVVLEVQMVLFSGRWFWQMECSSLYLCLVKIPLYRSMGDIMDQNLYLAGGQRDACVQRGVAAALVEECCQGIWADSLIWEMVQAERPFWSKGWCHDQAGYWRECRGGRLVWWSGCVCGQESV